MKDLAKLWWLCSRGFCSATPWSSMVSGDRPAGSAAWCIHVLQSRTTVHHWHPSSAGASPFAMQVAPVNSCAYVSLASSHLISPRYPHPHFPFPRPTPPPRYAAMLVVRFVSDFCNSVRSALFTRLLGVTVNPPHADSTQSLAFAQALLALTLMDRYVTARDCNGWPLAKRYASLDLNT